MWDKTHKHIQTRKLKQITGVAAERCPALDTHFGSACGDIHININSQRSWPQHTRRTQRTLMDPMDPSQKRSTEHTRADPSRPEHVSSDGPWAWVRVPASGSLGLGPRVPGPRVPGPWCPTWTHMGNINPVWDKNPQTYTDSEINTNHRSCCRAMSSSIHAFRKRLW